jgi:hypothetical protein
MKSGKKSCTLFSWKVQELHRQGLNLREQIDLPNYLEEEALGYISLGRNL